jgi:hypothetical protein
MGGGGDAGGGESVSANEVEIIGVATILASLALLATFTYIDKVCFHA